MQKDSHVGNGLSPEVRSFLERASAGHKVAADGMWIVPGKPDAGGAGSSSLSDLVQLREATRKIATDYDRGDVNTLALMHLLDGIDEDIRKLVESSGNDEAVAAHRRLRDKYEAEMLTLEDPAIVALREARFSDAERAMLDPHTGPASIRAVKQVLGDRWDTVSHSMFATLVAGFKDSDGNADLAGLTAKLLGMDPTARLEIYGQRGEAIMVSVHKYAESSRLVDEAKQTPPPAEKTQSKVLEDLKAERDRKIKALDDLDALIRGDGNVTAMLKDQTLFQGKTRLGHLIAFVGPEGLKEMANLLLDYKIREASTTISKGEPVVGVVRPEEVLAWYEGFRGFPETDKFFKVDAETAARYSKTMSDLEVVASAKRNLSRTILFSTCVLLLLAVLGLVFLWGRYTR